MQYRLSSVSTLNYLLVNWISALKLFLTQKLIMCTKINFNIKTAYEIFLRVIYLTYKKTFCMREKKKVCEILYNESILIWIRDYARKQVFPMKEAKLHWFILQRTTNFSFCQTLKCAKFFKVSKDGVDRSFWEEQQ